VEALCQHMDEVDGQMDGVMVRQTGRQTDMTKLTVAFRNFENSPEKLFPSFGYRNPELPPRINSRPSRSLTTP
jgi:hypothetical protein